MKNIPAPKDPGLGSLDLSGLDEHVDIGAKNYWNIVDKENQKIAEYEAKYGKAEGLRRYMEEMCGRPDPDFDEDMKAINTYVIWYGGPILRPGDFSRKAHDRMHELYGSEYAALCVHDERASHIGELLIMDAVKTGKWKELPDELQAEYHRRVGDRA